MQVSKQAPGSEAAVARPSSSAASLSAQPSSHASCYPGSLGAHVPISAYLIVPMDQHPAQVGASIRPSAPNLPGGRTPSRVSLRPPPQVLNVQAGVPGIFPSQPSPSSLGKKIAASPKVQTPNSGLSKRSVQKESLLEGHPQLFESVRAKFRENLAAALGVYSDHLNGQQSALNVSPIGSADAESVDDIVVGASESASKLNSERQRTSDIDAGANVCLNEPQSKRQKTSDELTEDKKVVTQNVQVLAFRIEEELFKLFGGVNKKYKEKGRSLLFNLKDKSNPLLREQVLSGDITPKFLCSMTTEELASKELSAWRLAKAEELEKMVVRPDREVDRRQFVWKNHKGEFHVEVEESDGISLDVELGGDSLSLLSKSIESQTKYDNRESLHKGDEDSDNIMHDEVGGKSNNNIQSNLEEYLAHEKADPVQECMVDDLKDTEKLQGVILLDKFTEALDSKLPYEDPSTETAEDAFTNKASVTLKPEIYHIAEDKPALSEFQLTCDVPSPQEKCQSKIESPKNVLVPSLCQAKSKEEMRNKASAEVMVAEKLDTRRCSVSVPGAIMQSNATNGATLTHGSLWEGTIHFNPSSLTTVVAVFKSGEKPSTNDWSCSVEIKGRVRLSVFQEFLEHLPNSRSRAVAVTELRWKEGSLESGRQHLLQIIDSYITDERVGLVKPVQGVELYLCPSHGKVAQILAEHLPKEHLGSLTVSGEASVIGFMVWRRSRVSTRIPTRHDDSKRPSISRSQQAVIASSVPMPSQRTKPTASHLIHPNEHRRLKDDDDSSGAVPPGSEEGDVKHNDDLPEPDFVSVPGTPVNVATLHNSSSTSQQHVLAVSPPLDLVNQVVSKYSNRYFSAQPCEDYDDDLHPLDQGSWPVRRYGNRYVSGQPWENYYEDLPELGWDPIRSGHQQARYPQPLLPLTEYGQQTHHYYHRHLQHLEHYEQQHAMATRQLSPVPQFYARPQQRWNYQSVMHAEKVMPMEDVVRQSCFAMEPENLTRRRPGPRRFWEWGSHGWEPRSHRSM